jgi:hypothetical protein
MSSKQQLFGLLALQVVLLLGCSTNDSVQPMVKQGDFTQSIVETGELSAVNARTFVMQRYGRYWYEMKIIGLQEHGKRVEVGDSVIQFDPSEVKKFIISRETDLETQKANLEKIIVQNDNRISELNSSLLTEQASFDLKKLEMEQSKYESDKTKRIKELEFKQSEIELEKVKRRIKLNEIIAKNDLLIQQIRVNRVQEEVKGAYDVLPQLTIRTPIPGIFQVAKKRRGRELMQVGDEVYYGTPIGSVPDLRWMKVNTVVNEADFMKVSIGQKVKVRLDALKDVEFQGEVTYISKLCHPVDDNARQKVFDVEVKINESDERLKPGMTVSCEYLCAELQDVFYVPLNCVETTDKKHFIYIDKGVKVEKVQVQTGPSNNASIVVAGNIESGQKLVPIAEISPN